jgi:glutathione-regulated potassium-efflux system ancillary protein KefG
MKNVLVVYAHPYHNDSKYNKYLIDGIRNMNNVEVSDLYFQYPDYKIDIVKEQQLLLNSDVIILQFPYYWFNTTPLMKAYIDEVFTENFAYGKGNKLKNKSIMCSITTGGSLERYANDHGFDFSDLLKPFERTASYCEMTYLPPFIVSDVYNLDDKELSSYIDKYRLLINEL